MGLWIPIFSIYVVFFYATIIINGIKINNKQVHIYTHFPMYTSIYVYIGIFAFRKFSWCILWCAVMEWQLRLWNTSSIIIWMEENTGAKVEEIEKERVRERETWQFNLGGICGQNPKVALQNCFLSLCDAISYSILSIYLPCRYAS